MATKVVKKKGRNEVSLIFQLQFNVKFESHEKIEKKVIERGSWFCKQIARWEYKKSSQSKVRMGELARIKNAIRFANV